MATSSKDDKNAKVMDVSRPGRSAPPSSAKPIIVSNRPMLRQDPMMAAPDGLDKSEPVKEEIIPVSRTAKTIPVGTTANDGGQSAPVASAEPAADSADATTAKTPAASSAPVSAPTASELAAKLESPTPPAAAPASDDATAEIASTPETKPAESEPAAAAPEASSTDSSPTETPPAASDDDADETSTSDQLAPNQALEEAKQKEEEAKAARLAEEEKIVASKQFYLPMQVNEERRGLDRILLVLALVLVMALFWADVVLDAGIVHVGGVHALTHFFS